METSCWIICFSVFYIMLNRYVAGNNNVGLYGGTPATIKEAPFMASVWCNGVRYMCGGSVIHDQFILTAAHCINRTLCPMYRVILGTTNLKENGDKYNVESVIVHRSYNSINLDCDIALLKLSTPIVFTPTVDIIKTADRKFPLNRDMNLTVFGWGATEHKKISNMLLKINIPFFGGPKKCDAILNGIYGTSGLIEVQSHPFTGLTTRMFCAGGNGKTHGPGDSGSPIIYHGVQVGLASYHVERADQIAKSCQKPAVYTKLSKFSKWIKQQIAKSLL